MGCKVRKMIPREGTISVEGGPGSETVHEERRFKSQNGIWRRTTRRRKVVLKEARDNGGRGFPSSIPHSTHL